MAIAITLEEYLSDKEIAYDVIPHTFSNNSLKAASAANIPAEKLAKAILLKDEYGYLMAVLPADHKLKLKRVSRNLHRNFQFATENEISGIFKDCDFGAIPPTGDAYNLNVIVDTHLADCNEIFFEAGDHVDLIHLSGNDFRKLMRRASYSNICD